jgi:hypothetical protein
MIYMILNTGCSKRPSSEAAASEEAKAYFLPYVEPLSDARTKLEDFFNILLITQFDERMLVFAPRFSHLDP